MAHETMSDRVRAFDIVGDVDELNAWRASHGLQPVTRSAIPFCGLIVPGVAAGFVYRTDSDTALLEGLVTNPEASSEERNAALEVICPGLIEEARTLGFSRVFGLVLNADVLKRAERLGFENAGHYTVITRSI